MACTSKQPVLASRLPALGMAFCGACTAGVAIAAIRVYILGTFNPMLGSKFDAFIVHSFEDVAGAVIICLGSGAALLLLPRIVSRHSKRLEDSAMLSAAASYFTCVSINWMLDIARSPYLNVGSPGDRVAKATLAFVIAAMITYGIVRALILRGHLLSPSPRLCVHCGYPIGSSPVCTECGEPVRTTE